MACYWAGGQLLPKLMITKSLSPGINVLAHWGWVMYIYVGKLAIIDSDNGLSPIRCQAIIWINQDILSIRP